MQDEIGQIQDRMVENRELNKTLTLELSVYDQMYQNKENSKSVWLDKDDRVPGVMLCMI